MKSKGMKFWVMAIMILGWMLCGCGFQPLTGEKPLADLTVMGYFNGDNDLADVLHVMINKCEAEAPSSATVNVVILYDGHADIVGPEWAGTRLFYVTRDVDKVVVTSPYADMGELDMGSPATLERFIRETLVKYPAKKTMLVFAGHGEVPTGSIRENGEDVKYALSPDVTSRSGMTLPDLRGAIKRALAAANEGRKLDLFVLYACLGNSVSMNYELDDVTKMLIGSPDTIVSNVKYDLNMDGIKFWVAIRQMAENPEIGKRALAESTIDATLDPYRDLLDYVRRHYPDEMDKNMAQVISKVHGALSAIDSEKLDGFMTKFKKLSDLLKVRLTDAVTRGNTAKALTLAMNNSRQYYGMPDLVDFLAGIERHAEDAEIRAACLGLRHYAAKALVLYERSEYFENALSVRSHGMSLYFPSMYTKGELFREMQDFFKNSRLAQDTSWAEVTALYWVLAAGHDPEPHLAELSSK